MTDLRNPNIRTKDLRKLIGWRAQALVWERENSRDSEWIFASVESEKYRIKLINWLKARNIDPSCACIMADSALAKPRQTFWGDVVESPELFFGKSAFHLYDLDLTWALEYQPQEVARFGKFVAKQNS